MQNIESQLVLDTMIHNQEEANIVGSPPNFLGYSLALYDIFAIHATYVDRRDEVRLLGCVAGDSEGCAVRQPDRAGLFCLC